RQHWELRVNVVPRELRKTTKDVLVNHAFPLICNKLNTGYKEIRDFSLLKVVYYKNLNHFKFIGIVDGEKREEQILS
ncbi:MAG: hypothetical protein KDK45_03345, partial [Leptospiraceae bacterium]|nr:hypothetical protein [Leptospiraceae bacterium]